MRVRVSNLLVAAVAAVGMASMASATPLCSAGTSDVTAGGTGTYSCTIGNLTFSDFTVSTTGDLDPTIVGLTANPPGATGQSGSEAYLEFQFSAVFSDAPLDVGDLLISYQVTGGILGVDTSFTGVPTEAGGTVQLLEKVCSVAFVNTNCDGSLYTLTATSTNGSAASTGITFASLATAYISKDISFNGAAMSEFVNSQLVPEPMTFSLMGAGLLGLGLLGRRLRKK
jgi:hypothetical protein